MTTVALAIREYVDSHNWTQTEAAGHLGIAQSDVSNIKNGRLSRYTLDKLLRIADRADLEVKLEVGQSCA